MKRKIIKSAIAVLIASSLVTAVWAQYHMESTMNRDGLTEVKEFILSLPEDKQTAIADLHEAHKTEMKALMDTYRDVEKTDIIKAKIETKMKELHAKHLAEVKVLLAWVEWAEAIIAKMEEKHQSMMSMSGSMDMMMSGTWNMDMQHMMHTGMWMMTWSWKMDMSHMMKGKMQEEDPFIKTLTEEKREDLKTLTDAHHADIKALMDTYKNVEITDAINDEMELKVKALHDSYVASLKTLLTWIEWAEAFIAKAEAKKPSDMMNHKWKMGEVKKRDNQKKVQAHKAKYDKKIGKTLSNLSDHKLHKLLSKLDQISEKIQNDASFTEEMKNDYLDKIEALRTIITAEVGN